MGGLGMLHLCPHSNLLDINCCQNKLNELHSQLYETIPGAAMPSTGNLMNMFSPTKAKTCDAHTRKQTPLMSSCMNTCSNMCIHLSVTDQPLGAAKGPKLHVLTFAGNKPCAYVVRLV
jgi:hypothetical protein